MALGSQNKQQMNPAQFVRQVNPEGLFRPGDYSRPAFDGNVNTDSLVRSAQEAMQRQAEFEIAYQEQQNNFGWDLLAKVQAALDKGVTTGISQERLRGMTFENDLAREFGRQERQADLESKQAGTRQTQAQARESEVRTGLVEKYGDRDTRTVIEAREAETDAKRAELPFVGRAQEARIAADETQTAVNQKALEDAVLKEAKRRNAFKTLNEENMRIDNLLVKARNGEKRAYETLMTYATPYGLEEDAPQEFGALRERLLLAQKMATDSATRELSEKSRLGYELLAQKLILESPSGRPIASRIISILKTNPGFLGFEQEEAIQTAFNVYKTQINPSTKLNLPQILDSYSIQSTDERTRLRREAQERDRRNIFAPERGFKDTASLINAASRILTSPTGFDVSQEVKNEASALLLSLTQDPELRLVDPQIRTRILIEAEKIQQSQPGKEPGKKPKQDVQRANQQNFDIYGAP